METAQRLYGAMRNQIWSRFGLDCKTTDVYGKTTKPDLHLCLLVDKQKQISTTVEGVQAQQRFGASGGLWRGDCVRE